MLAACLLPDSVFISIGGANCPGHGGRGEACQGPRACVLCLMPYTGLMPYALQGPTVRGMGAEMRGVKRLRASHTPLTRLLH